MASHVPIVRQRAWISILPHLLVAGVCLLVFYLAGANDFPLYGVLLYLALSLVLRNFVANDQRRGMQLVKRREFTRAIPCFEQSVAFFARHAWVDQYRYLVMLSSSRMSYREMALCNLAFCYSQLGDGPQAKAYYEQALHEFPDSAIASTNLQMIRTFESSQPATKLH